MPPESAKKTDGEHEADFEMELTAVEETEGAKGRPVDAGALGGAPTAQVPRLVSFQPPKRFKGRLFSLKNNSTKKANANFAGATGRSFDYEEMYDEDAYGEEAFPDARVWKVYNDEAQLFDLERIEAWRDAIDVLLVFIGLFAAVVSAFLIETSKSLQPDYGQVNVMISYAILRSLNNSVLPHPSLSPDVLDQRFGEASKDNSVVNALWYTSLTISLSTALLAMLIKQWLHQYMTLTSGTAREQARNRQFRHVGLEKYRVPLIIDLLPTLLHLALGLFLVGLAIYLKPLNHTMFSLVVIITSIPYLFYFVSITMPFFDPQCPYRAPPSFYIYPVQRYLSNALRPFFQHIQRFWMAAREPIHRIVGILNQYARQSAHQLVAAGGNLLRKAKKIWSRTRQLLRIPTAEPKDTGPTTPLVDSALPVVFSSTLSLAEKQAVSQRAQQLDVDSIVYLCQTSSNTNVLNIALEAFGGLAPSDADLKAVGNIIYTDLYAAIQRCRDLNQEYDNFPEPGMERRHNRLIRALCIQKEVTVGDPYHLGLHYSRREEINTLDIYNRRLFPWFDKTSTPHFAALVALCPQFSYTLSMWAALIQLAKRHQPDDVVIRAILVAPLHLPLDSSEVGAVPFCNAMQRPFIRGIARDYLGISISDEIDLLSLSLSSVTPLLSKSKENEKYLYDLGVTAYSHSSYPPPPGCSDPFAIPHILSYTLPPLFQSLAHQVRNVTLEGNHSETLRTLITDLLSFPHTNRMPWKILSCLLEIWNAPSDDSIRAISTPTAMNSILGQFRIRGHFKEEDAESIKDAVRHLGTIFRRSREDNASADLQKAFFSRIQELDLLPLETQSQSKMSTIRVFWSADMCGELMNETLKIHDSRLRVEWFDGWVEYIYAPERLAFICSQLAARAHFYYLKQLFRVRPLHPSWPKVIKILLSRFIDQTYLESMVNPWNHKILKPRGELSLCLNKIKDILINYHPVLAQPGFDIPRFDDEDNLIPSYSTTNPTTEVDTLPLAPNASEEAREPQLVNADLGPSRPSVPSTQSDSLAPSPVNPPFQDPLFDNDREALMKHRHTNELFKVETASHEAAEHTSVDMVHPAFVDAAGPSPQDSLLVSKDLDLAKQSAESRAEMGVVSCKRPAC